MNLKQAIKNPSKIEDSCLFQFMEDTNVSEDTLFNEINQYLSSDKKEEFIKDFVDAWDLPKLEHKITCLEEFKDEYLLSEKEILEELNQWLSEDELSEMIESIKTSWDI